MKINLKKALLRSWFYFRTGYPIYLSIPVALISYASAIYYLAIEDIPVLKALFPKFHIFLLSALLVLPTLGILLGWMHYKRILSPFYRAELDVQVEANPYAQNIVSPVNLPLFKVLSQLAKMHNVDTSELDAIIERSKEKFGMK